MNETFVRIAVVFCLVVSPQALAEKREIDGVVDGLLFHLSQNRCGPIQLPGL